ncbi:MAG TPA: DEAD/DEAH box helicase family protein, partial [Candidatus Limnocylindrales bacterium]|nr:DEAD/DEAH box helicase family protein [Candidatus Limnocylindrales bacterium]
MKLRPYQLQAKEAVQAEWQKGLLKTLLVLPTGCHAKGEKVLMSNGDVLQVEEICVGDRLMGSDGAPRNVLHLTRGTGQLYKVIPVKGEPFVVTEDHKLTLVKTGEKKKPKYPSQKKAGEIVDVTVGEWLCWSKYKKHVHKLIRCNGVDIFERQEELPVSPYFIGVLLGDGGLITTINVTTPEPEIVEVLESEAKHYGMYLDSTPSGKANTYIFKGQGAGRKGSDLHQALVKLGLRRKLSGEKHIPLSYKASPRAFRLEVIAGLIDTDGSASDGGYDFISKSKQLSEDLAFMCRSVGLAAYVTECEKSCQNNFTGTYYRVSISGNCSVIPCRVERKKQRKRQQIKDVLRTGFSVVAAGEGEYFGFTVDGDNRYLLSDFTITHNCGKTIVFSKLIEDCVRNGERALVLAHRGELLDQAADKLSQSTGLGCAVEKADDSCLGSWYRVVVGSVQSLMRENRLKRFPTEYFDTIIVDEAHHCLADSYQRVLGHFGGAKVLGVTATADRGDMRNLGEYFESLAYQYTLPKAIKEGYLSPIKALTIPLKLDLTGVGQQAGDFKTKDLGTALDPYLYQIADEMIKHCSGRKTVVFLPLIKTSQKFRDILNSKGFNAAEINGNSQDRAEILADFEAGKYDVLCNSMLLIEGWDCPPVDCIVVLRPTKIRSLYSQMVGRGTRLFPGKDHLLLLDFLWHTERHELCHPAHLICESPEVAQKMTEDMAAAGCPIDLEQAEQKATEDVIAAREEALAKKLQEMRNRKHKLVDPLQFEMSIHAEDLAGYIPAFGWECGPPSDKQVKALEKMGIFPDEIDSAGKAAKILDR